MKKRVFCSLITGLFFLSSPVKFFPSATAAEVALEVCPPPPPQRVCSQCGSCFDPGAPDNTDVVDGTEDEVSPRRAPRQKSPSPPLPW